jgi:hypothetical protein
MALAATTAPGAASAPAAKAPEGYVTTTVKSAGLSLALPFAWIMLDPKSPQSDAALQRAVDKNPNLSNLIAQWSSIRDQVKLWALDSAAGSFAKNVLVLPTPFAKAQLQKPEQVESALRSELGSNVTSLSSRKVKVGGKTAVEVDATAPVNTSDGNSLDAYVTLLLVPTKKGVMDLDYTSSTPRASDDVLHTITGNVRIL